MRLRSGRTWYFGEHFQRKELANRFWQKLEKEEQFLLQNAPITNLPLTCLIRICSPTGLALLSRLLHNRKVIFV